MTTSAPSAELGTMSFASRYLSRKMLLMLLLGAASGLPLALTGSTLQAWLKLEHVDETILAVYFSLAGMPYALKFLWAPFIDRHAISFSIPGISWVSKAVRGRRTGSDEETGRPFLGRRRGWIVASQVSLIVLIIVMGMSNPRESLEWVGVLAVLTACASATQDIAVDAYRTELLAPEERGTGAAVFVFGYRLGMLLSSAFALILASQLSWQQVYFFMAAALIPGIVAAILAPEPEAAQPPRTLGEAVIGPLRDLLTRPGVSEILLFVLLYKVGDVLAGTLTMSFMLEMGFTKAEIGSIGKTVGIVSAIAGGFVGAEILSRRGMRWSLVVFGVLQAASTLLFGVLAMVGHDRALLAVVISGEHFTAGMGSAALFAFFMSLCNTRFTATQYAVLTSVMAVTGRIFGMTSGVMVKGFGWPLFFTICTAAAIPGIALALTRFPYWGVESDAKRSV